MGNLNQSRAQEACIAAIENNLSAWIPIFGKLGQSYTNSPPGVDRSITDVPVAVLNSVINARLTAEQVDAAVDITQKDSRAHHVPILWWITPSTRPVDLEQRLKQRGFTVEDDGPGMAVDLGNVRELPPASRGFSIRLAEGDAAWREWCIVLGWGFGGSAPNELFIRSWHRFVSGLASETVRPYLGYINDKPVATSLVFLAAGVAGIYCVATVPEARRRGIGAYMTQFPLLYARSKGFGTGILQSSPMGLGVYKSLGFQEYCRIVSYRWTPEPSAG